ncbi:MAG: hypothetical protein ACTHLR_00010 [Rhizomicrobium sp.]
MSKYNSDGEVYGSKALTLAMIAVSAFVLAGTIYSPPVAQTAQISQPIAEQVVVTAHPAPAGKVAG